MITAKIISDNGASSLALISLTVTEKIGSASYAQAEFAVSENVCKCGDKLYITDGDDIIFSGFIFEFSHKLHTLSVLAYDCLRYLQCTESYFTAQTTASSLIRRIASDFQLPVGKICETAHIIPLIDFDEQSLMNIISYALSETKAHTGKSYLLISDDCKLSLVSSQSFTYGKVISDKNVICAYEKVTSADSCANVVKLTSADKNGYRHSYTAIDEQSVSELGYLKFTRAVAGKNTFQLKELAEAILAQKANPVFTAALECAFLPALRAGMLVTVSAEKPSLYGKYTVESVVHSLTKTKRQTFLQLKGASDGVN